MEREITVNHPEGLHARPAAEFARTAGRFQSRVELVAAGESANGRSLLGLLKLGIKSGQAVVIRAEGEDAESAVNQLASLLERAAV